MKVLRWSNLVAGIAMVSLAAGWGAELRVIQVNGADTGRVFEGIGAVSAGASSRLLLDYPEPQRSEVLDCLFRPRFGAALQHLKVEIGGDVNSTDGCEPSHQHTRTDENYQRGYEWWLMKEARRRQPGIFLDCLEWGAPAWIGDGRFYSQDNADYIVKFLLGARRVHGLELDYVGVWNETACNTNWIKQLRRTLDAAGLARVKIVAADLVGPRKWNIADDVTQDPELARSVAAIGVHYPHYQSPAAAKSCGKPLWASEDGPWQADWPNACKLARIYNRNYVLGRMTKTEIWSPVTAYYDNLPLPGSGLLRANEPWSGHYTVEPAVWITAHTTQFAAPGWQYLDAACAEIPGGSCVALKAPGGRDYSVIIETMDASAPQTLVLQMTNLPGQPLHVWRTSQHEQFLPQADAIPAQNRFVLSLDPQCVYSLTTTRGQHKGICRPPPAQTFPLPYHEDFETTASAAAPRYFSDQAGIFEVVPRTDGRGQALRQVVPRKGIEWHSHLNAFPETFLGATNWADYVLSLEARVAGEGFVSLFGRIGRIPQNANPPDGYWLKVNAGGYWELRVVANHGRQAKLMTTTLLASGRTDFPANTWRRLALKFSRDRISVIFADKTAGVATNSAFSQGMVGLGCGWHAAEFDNLSVTPEHAATAEE